MVTMKTQNAILTILMNAFCRQTENRRAGLAFTYDLNLSRVYFAVAAVD